MANGHSKSTVFESIIPPVPSMFYETHKLLFEMVRFFFSAKDSWDEWNTLSKMPK
jgi:hypothetical protein